MVGIARKEDQHRERGRVTSVRRTAKEVDGEVAAHLIAWLLRFGSWGCSRAEDRV